MWHHLHSLLRHNWQYLWFWKTFFLWSFIFYLSTTHIYTRPQRFLPIQMMDRSLDKTMPVYMKSRLCYLCSLNIRNMLTRYLIWEQQTESIVTILEQFILKRLDRCRLTHLTSKWPSPTILWRALHLHPTNKPPITAHGDIHTSEWHIDTTEIFFKEEGRTRGHGITLAKKQCRLDIINFHFHKEQ